MGQTGNNRQVPYLLQPCCRMFNDISVAIEYNKFDLTVLIENDLE